MDHLQRNIEAYDQFADVQTQPQTAGEKHPIKRLSVTRPEQKLHC